MAGAPLAEPGQRLLARIVDTLIVGLPVIVVVQGLVSGPTVDIVAPPAVAGCMLLYESMQLALWGRTLGKRFAGIEVIFTAPAGAHPRGALSGEAHPGGVQPGEALSKEVHGGGLPGGEYPAGTGLGGAQPAAERSGEERPGAGAFGAEERSGEHSGDARPAEEPSGGTVGESARLGVPCAVLRAAAYSLPIAARPIPVLGLLAGIFWVANAGLLYEGTRRQAFHDRLAGTVVVKRPLPDSSAF